MEAVSAAYTKAQNIQAIVGSLVDVNASAIRPVPPIEADRVPDAFRKIETQIFELSDALAAVVAEVDRLAKRR